MSLPTPPTYSLTSTGLTVPTQAQLLTYYNAVFLAIYGVDLTTQDVSSPDNQLVNILIQGNLDLQDLVVQIFNSFDPDNALGTVLDQRVAINGIQREAATYSTTNITIVISTTNPINLYGLDQTAQPVYTVSDSSGNQWQLLFTQLSVSSGTYIYGFQSATPGANVTTVNTITQQVTIVIGVTSVNNPDAQTFLGTNEESDNALKIRRQAAVALPSQGYLDGLIAALQNVTGVTYANVIENDTGTTISSGPNNGLPGHSIWCIVAAGNESSASTQAGIAQAIYTKRNAGCGMFGGVSYTVTRPSGNQVIVSWDWVVEVPVFVVMYALSIDGIHLPNIQTAAASAGLLSSTAGIPSLFLPTPSQTISANEISTAANAVDPNTFATNIGFSTSSIQCFTLSGTVASGNFKLSYNGNLTASISYNAAIAKIQSDLQAVTGLGSVLVTGGFYTFTVSSANATVGATYTNNSNTFTVLATIASGTTLICSSNAASSSGAPGASGTLTKASGTGDSTITFSAYTPPLASGNLTIVMAGVTNPLLIGVNSNSLEDGSSNPISLNFLNNTPNYIQVVTFSDVAASGNFKVTYNGNSSSSIAYNASQLAIQNAVQAVTWLTSVTVTGSVASKNLVITMIGVTNPSLVSITSNTLENGSSVAISASIIQNYSSVLPVPSSVDQFTLNSTDTIILASNGVMFLTAPGATYTFSSGTLTSVSATLVHDTTLQFTGYGGYTAQAYVFAIATQGSSGSTLGASTGLYTAGSAGTDVITVTDALGNVGTCTIVVT